MDAINIIEATVGLDLDNRCKSTIGFFVETKNDDGTDQLLDEFYVEKPSVDLFEFSDEEGNEYYSVEFSYFSKLDKDLNQQWRFLERFVQLVSEATETNKIPFLTVSFIPVSLKGKFSILAKNAFANAITRTEYAGEDACMIKMLFLKENVLFLSHEEELVDRRYLEEEVSREIDAELGGTSEIDR